MHDELQSILKEQSYCSWFMLKVPLTKIERNERTVIFFVLLLGFVNVVVWLFILPAWKGIHLFLSITFGITDLLLFISFALAALTDPGYLKRDPTLDFQELLNTCDPYNLCPDCKVIRTPRSRHCNICNRWVERFDHHCPYLNNWVGYRNHFYFLMFISLLVLNISLLMFMIIYGLVKQNFETWSFIEFNDTFDKTVFYIFSSAIILICIFFLPFTTILCLLHSWNFCKNKTTNERFSRKNDGDNSSVISKSILETSNNDTSSSNATLLVKSNDTMLRTTFMGPKDGSWIGNWARMWFYKPPTQERMRNEYQ